MNFQLRRPIVKFKRLSISSMLYRTYRRNQDSCGLMANT
jgi:hypothetical protein